MRYQQEIVDDTFYWRTM